MTVLETVRDFDDYQLAALRTFNRKHNKIMDILHCVLGTAGEAVEVAETNHHTSPATRIKEVGDCLWYSAVLSYELGISFSEITYSAIHMAEGGVQEKVAHLSKEHLLSYYAGNLCEEVKKSMFYDREVKTEVLRENITRYVAVLMLICQSMNTLLLEVGQVNIAKLKARFPDKFDRERAINRDPEIVAQLQQMGG